MPPAQGIAKSVDRLSAVMRRVLHPSEAAAAFLLSDKSAVSPRQPELPDRLAICRPGAGPAASSSAPFLPPLRRNRPDSGKGSPAAPWVSGPLRYRGRRRPLESEALKKLWFLSEASGRWGLFSPSSSGAQVA